MLSTVVAVAFALLLVVGLPALSYSTARNPEVWRLPRLQLYASAVLSQWLLTLVGLGVVHLVACPVLVQGFSPMPVEPALEWAGGIATGSLAALAALVGCERRGWLPRESGLVYRLIPRSPREKLWAVFIVAPTAAFCEEFLFRGFLLAQLHVWFGSLSWAWAASSVVFGLSHFYQGWSGMIQAGLLGALLACPVVLWGSLYPAMLAHWWIDAVALVWLGPWMLGGSGAEPKALP